MSCEIQPARHNRQTTHQQGTEKPARPGPYQPKMPILGHIWYIPSEKIGQFFWPPRNGFFGINYHQWTWGNAFWPFLAPPDPWGVSGGVGGGQGGSVGPKFSNFFGATFGFQNAKFWIVWTENTPFSSFLAKFSPPGDQKCPFWAEMVEHKSAFFSKTSSLNCLKMHQNKVLGSILI